MRFLLSVFLTFLISLFSISAQSERPESIVIPVSSLGDVSDTRKKILQNTLEDELKEHFMLISQERFEEAQEKAFEELDYEECTEDQCIMMIQEMLQVENVFHLEVIGEGSDTQLSLSWRTLDEKKKETEVCMGCGTFQLNEKVGGLVEKLVGVKQVVKDRITKKFEESVKVQSQKEVPKILKKPEIQTPERNNSKIKFVSVGAGGILITSENGISWNSLIGVTDRTLHDVTYGNGKFVSVGIDGTIIYSDNGFSWNSIITRPKVGLRGIEYGNNRFIAVGGHKYFTSIDGKSWNSIDNPGKNLWGITFGDSIFVSVGDLGTIMTSFGETWSLSYSETTSRISGVTYGNGVFVAANQKGEILTSKFGNDWSIKNSGTSEYLLDVAYGDGTFVVVGDTGTILNSPDGISWTKINSTFKEDLWGVTYGNGLFVTVGTNGIILSSPNGKNWTKRKSGTSMILFGVTSIK